MHDSFHFGDINGLPRERNRFSTRLDSRSMIGDRKQFGRCLQTRLK